MDYIVHTLPDLTYASPRYNCIANSPTSIIPNNYKMYDAVNGDYDKFYPCYTIHTNNAPQYRLIDHEGKSVEVKGDLVCYVVRDRYKGRIQGMKDDPDIPYNSTLEKQYIYQTEYGTIKLNPGWTSIQLKGIQPLYLVRVLSNSKVTELVFSNVLDSKSNVINFPKGTIVRYKNNLYKAAVNTEGLPDIKIDQWVKVPTDLNVFKADVFILTTGGSSYLTEVKDKKRKFNAIADPTGTLVTFNVSYYHD